MKHAAESTNHALTGLLILGGVALSGLVLLMVAQAGGAQTWPFNAFLLASAATFGIYVKVVYRSQQSLRERVETTEQRREGFERTLVTALDRLRDGDLVNCSEQSKSLPGRLAVSLSNATNSLDVLAQQIQSSSIEVASAANAVNEIASELADNAAAQADLAQAAEESGTSGQGAVEEAVDGVEEVKKRISGIASRAEILGTRSKEIYRVLDLITEIAQETHILSLNAAIEAAAAGDHSRRFSVVAEEVRRLAQRSQESVESVRNLLDEFAGSIRATVVATEEGSAEAGRVLERARSAASAIEDLRGASSDTARVAREISLATQQQNAASDEVVLTLKEVSQVEQRMAEGLKHFTETADRLNRLGLVIQMLAQSFHLDSPHSLKHMAETWSREVRRRLGNWESIERLLEDLVHRQPYVECLYFFDGRRN